MAGVSQSDPVGVTTHIGLVKVDTSDGDGQPRRGSLAPGKMKRLVSVVVVAVGVARRSNTCYVGGQSVRGARDVDRDKRKVCGAVVAGVTVICAEGERARAGGKFVRISADRVQICSDGPSRWIGLGFGLGVGWLEA